MSIVTIYMKHDDRASIMMDEVEIHGDYLPHVNNNIGGDDTQFKIDNETGKIIGWEPIKIEDGKFVTR